MKKNAQYTVNTLFQNQQKFPCVISLDVHDQNTYTFGANIITGEIIVDENIPGCFKNALQKLDTMNLDKAKTLVIYEAGNQGFYPHRLLSENGYHCRIIAPSSIPHRGKEQKTDRDDAVDNLQYHASGMLHYVTVPTREDELARECMRYRLGLTNQVTRHKQKILSFLTRHGLSYTLTKTNWTKKHREWLKTVAVDVMIRIILDARLAELGQAEQQLLSIDTQLDVLIDQNPLYQQRYNNYKMLPGFGRVNSMIMVFEGSSLERFRHPNSLMNYTGLIPQKHSSGTSDPALHITKGGNFFLRLALVGAAKVYGNNRMVAHALLRAKELDEPYKAFVTKTITRLSSRYQYLRAHKKHVNKIKCAIARELCGVCWELFVKVNRETHLPIAA